MIKKMDLKAEILKEHSKRQALKIAKWIGDDRRRFKELMELFLHGEYRVTQRSAWIVSLCADRYPRLITPWLPAMLKKMQEPGVHDAVKRNVVRILAGIDIPRSLLGAIVTLCFGYLNSASEPIAVKVHSMTVLFNAAKREPDLMHELQGAIEQMLPFVGPALRSRGRKILRQIERGKRVVRHDAGPDE